MINNNKIELEDIYSKIEQYRGNNLIGYFYKEIQNIDNLNINKLENAIESIFIQKSKIEVEKMFNKFETFNLNNVNEQNLAYGFFAKSFDKDERKRIIKQYLTLKAKDIHYSWADEIKIKKLSKVNIRYFYREIFRKLNKNYIQNISSELINFKDKF